MTPLLLLLAACTDDAPAPTDSAPQETVTPWSYEPEASEEPLSAAEVEALAAERLPRLLSIDPAPLYEAYDLAMSGQTRDCPGTWEIAGVIGWGNTCTAPTGWRYDGRSQGLHARNIEFDGAWYEEFGSLLSNALITSPDGQELRLVGYGDLWEQVLDDDTRLLTVYFMGEFGWAGIPEDDHWLRDRLSLSLISESAVTAEGERWWRLDGGVTPLGEPDPITLTAQDLTAREEACALEPSGALVLHAGGGQRYTLTLHGDSDDASLCDGCADITHEGEHIGQACLDFGAMFGWEARPW